MPAGVTIPLGWPYLHEHSTGPLAMPKETEIKLRVTRETLAALREHPLLALRRQGDWQRHELFNQYYDSVARDLAHNRVALRVRKDGQHYIQTLKTRGQSVAGLSERNEWEWPLERPELNVALLTDDCWPAALTELDRHSLEPIFRTDFVREKADLAWQSGNTEVIVEAALDLGNVTAGQQAEELCELELELRQGEPDALLELAIELAQDLPLMPSDISKAERGYRLYDPASYTLNLPLPSLTANQSVDEAFAAIAWQLLGNSQRLGEQYRFSGHWSLLVSWLEHLSELRALLSSLGQVVPRTHSAELRSLLDALLADWRPRIQAGQQDEAIRQAAPTAFAEELAKPRWGRFSLLLSRWLLRRNWCEGRNERGQRMGQAELGKWLPRVLADEVCALQLADYQGQPAALGEQLPRLERLLVWLRAARQILELPEVDRLYGELNKLHSLTLAKQTEELCPQIHTVMTLKAWKALVK